MQLTKSLLLIACYWYLIEVHAQQLLAKIELKSTPQFVMCHEDEGSLLITYSDEITTKGAIRTVRLTDNGELVPTNFDFPIVAIANPGPRHYYYASGKRKKAEIRAAIPSGDTLYKAGSSIPASDVLGIHVEEDSLILAELTPEGTGVSFATIWGTEIVRRDTYHLPIDLRKWISKDYPAEVYFGKSPDIFIRGRARVKVFKSDRLYVTIDAKMPQENDYTLLYVFERPGRTYLGKHFRSAGTDDPASFVLDGKLFQFHINPKHAELNAFALPSGDRLFRHEFDLSSCDSSIVYRDWTTNVIQRQSFDHLFRSSRYGPATLSVATHEDKISLLLGTHQITPNAMAPSLTPLLGPIAGLLQMAIGTAIMQAPENPGKSRYIPGQVSAADSTFVLGKYPAGSLLKTIDTHELQMQALEYRFTYKGYWPYLGGIVAAYYDRDIGRLSFLHFK